MKRFAKLITILLVLLFTATFMVACGDNEDGDVTPPVTTHVCDENCTYTTTEWFDNYRRYPKTLKCNVDSAMIIKRDKIEIATADEFMLLAEDLREGNFVGVTDFLLAKDIDMAQKTWTPIDFRVTKSHAYYGTVLTFDGNGKAIKNLTMSQDYATDAGIFGEVSGEIGFVFKNLTLDGAKIYGDVYDEKGSVSGSEKGIGAFIGHPRGIKGNITITDCTVINSEIKGAHWAGGFFGYICKETTNSELDSGAILVNITNSKIENSSVISEGSAGGIVGHAGGCLNVRITATGVTVNNVTITSLGDSPIKAGSFVGTVGLAKVTVTNSTFTENSVTSNNVKNTTRIYYGRFGGEKDAYHGRLSINGNVVAPHED